MQLPSFHFVLNILHETMHRGLFGQRVQDVARDPHDSQDVNILMLFIRDI